MNNREIKKCVFEILDSLYKRKGFDDWFDSLDIDIEQEIENELFHIMYRRLNQNKNKDE